ncbi:MAG: hypothetical protein R3Y28_02760 [Candidatus Gastranaerophilales bacterium]
MNIEKLAKHLKEFTQDEIEMIAECDCEMALKQLLNADKIEFKKEKYKYSSKEHLTFSIYLPVDKVKLILSFNDAVNKFLANYAQCHCKKRTYETYVSLFKCHITPFFENKNINEITNENIIYFYKKLQARNLNGKKFRNIMALLNQLIKYFQRQGVINKKCVFQVKRLTDKNKYDFDRLIIGSERN